MLSHLRDKVFFPITNKSQHTTYTFYKKFVSKLALTVHLFLVLHSCKQSRNPHNPNPNLNAYVKVEPFSLTKFYPTLCKFCLKLHLVIGHCAQYNGKLLQHILCII